MTRFSPMHKYLFLFATGIALLFSTNSIYPAFAATNSVAGYVTTDNTAPTNGSYRFTGTGAAVGDYAVTTNATSIIITDNAGNGDMLAITEPSAGNIMFTVAGRTFSVNGGAIINDNSGSLSLTNITSIVVNTAAGADTISVSAIAASLPSLTINGGVDNDTVNLNGDLTFAANASLDLDLQNDDAVPGADTVTVAGSANILTSGTGTITVKVSKNVLLSSGSSFETVNGGITIEANQQATGTTGDFAGLFLNSGALRTTGTGNITCFAKGGTTNVDDHSGVRMSGGIISSTATGAITLVGTGGTGMYNSRGLDINYSSQITAVNGSITITGTAGSGSQILHHGMSIINDSLVSTSGTGNITLRGTSGPDNGVQIATGGSIQTTGSGNISVTGTGGGSDINMANDAGTEIQATGGGSITLVADYLTIGAATPVISAGATGTVLLVPRTDGRAISVGGADIAGATLGIADGELDRITAGVVQIGDANSGVITISSVISPLDYKTLAFGNNVTFAATGGFHSTIGSTVNSHQRIAVVGTIDIDAAATLAFSGSYTPIAADGFILISNDGSDAISGTFSGQAEGSTLTLNSVPLIVSYIGDSGNDLVVGNNAPTLSDVADSSVSEDTATSPLGITIGDIETAAVALVMSGSSDNQTLVPDANIVFGGSGTARAVTVTPAANQMGSATITVNVTDGDGKTTTDTFVLTVNPVADTPSVTNATTTEDTQTTSGLVISRNATDGSEVTHFQITNITNGALFLNDGTTPITNGAFITFAQATAGLKFTPSASFAGMGSFNVQASTSNAVGDLGGSVVTATITVNPALHIGDITANEGNPLRFAVTLTNASATTITVEYTTVDGDALAGVDYVAQSGALTFAPGVISQTIAIVSSNDTFVELNETFTVLLQNGAGTTIGDDTGVGTIMDDDTTSLTISNTSVVEGDSGVINAIFPVTLSNPSVLTVTVHFTTSAGSATAGIDYTDNINGALSFAPGVTTQSIAIGVNGDVDVETDETFTVTLGRAQYATINEGAAQGIIVNDDLPPTPTATATATATPTETAVPPTATATATATATDTPLPPTATATTTAVPPTATATATSTGTAIPPTATATPTETTVPPTATATATATPTAVPPTTTPTATATATETTIPPTATATAVSPTTTPTSTATATETAVPSTATATSTGTAIPPTATATATATPTETTAPPTATATATTTTTAVPPTTTATATATATETTIPPTATATSTATSTATATTVPPTATATATATATVIPSTATATATATATGIPSTATATATTTPTNTPMPTATATSRPASIGDFVWHDLNGDGLQTADEPPLQGITVTLYRTAATAVEVASAPMNPITNTGVISTVTDLEGRYWFTGALPGNYFLAFTGPTTLVPTQCEQGADDLDSDACRIGFTHVGQSAIFTVTGQQRQPAWDAGFTKAVTVRGYAYLDENNNGQADSNEAAIPGVTVVLQDASRGARVVRAGASAGSLGGQELARAVTDADGVYNFSQLTPGRYQLLISPPTGFTLLTSALLPLPLLGPGETLNESAGLVALQPTNLIEEPEPMLRFYLPLIQAR